MIAYHGTLVQVTAKGIVEVERVQTSVRLEKRLLKVLKAVAELKDMSLGDLLEGIRQFLKQLFPSPIATAISLPYPGQAQ